MTDLPNHIGWLLWQANRSWTEAFVSRLRENGYPDITLAQTNVLGHLDRETGVRQTDIALQAGLTKQAVGQFLDELESAGLVERKPDPDDGRARLVFYTAQGQAFLKTADHIKSDIEKTYQDAMGASGLKNLKALLGTIPSNTD